MFPPPPAGQLNVPFGDAFTAGQQNENPNLTAWRQRQQQQRNLRFLMMFVLMLMMMEAEEPNMNDPRNYERMKQNFKKGLIDKLFLEEDIAIERKKLDNEISEVVKKDNRYKEILSLNADVDLNDITERLKKKTEMKEEDEQQGDEKKEDVEEDKGKDTLDESLEEMDQLIHHYPWNASGVYAGDWNRQPYKGYFDEDKLNKLSNLPEEINSDERIKMQVQRLKNSGKSIGVYILQDGFMLQAGNGSDNLSIVPEIEEASEVEQAMDVKVLEKSILAQYAASKPEQIKDGDFKEETGRIAIQLYSNSIPGMTEISFLDGFIRLLGVANNDILLRVRGVAVHKLGRLSLITEVAPTRSVLYIDSINEDAKEDVEKRRKLQRKLNQLNQLSSISPLPEDYSSKANDFLVEIRDVAMEMDIFMQNQYSFFRKGWRKMFETPGYGSFFKDRRASSSNPKHVSDLDYSRNLQSKDDETKSFHFADIDLSHMRPFPYVPDDEVRTEEKNIGIYRDSPGHQQIFEACEFEINLNISSTETKISDYEKLLLWQMEEFNSVSLSRKDKESIESLASGFSMNKKDAKISRVALATQLTGEIVSHSCEFLANVTVSTRRIDWDEAKGKAINYSFCMMVTSLAQIVLLLRQLLYTNAPSAATRVSLLCIGWQTLIDAQLFLAHLFFCMVMMPLLPAFSSVAFFELLIFAVIEMKYLTIIVRARSNSADPNSTTESVRRKVTFVRLQLYVAMLFSLMAFWYIGQNHLTVYMLGLFSFWIPQIIQNVITEAKRPLHKHYIYGITCTRLIAPFYFYGVPNNFWKAFSPDFQSDLYMCQVLVIWVGLQVAILVAQGKYGARFMIPARFLPPKFDYSRPIPASMLATLETASINSSSDSTINEIDITGTNEGTRNRMNGNTCKPSSTTIMEDPDNGPTLDCVICYSPIDIHNRKKYMLAPCEHLFHRECLEQWMDVKMECPICRHDLPAL